MKELSIEEKAKRYDEAIEIINDYYQKTRYSSLSCASNDIEVLEKAFPELKESEGERIVKAIKYALDHVFTNNTTVFEVTKEQCLAWLEKQGEQKSAEEYNITSIGSKSVQDKLREMIKKPKPIDDVLEQKPIDKVEPKFKVGDKIRYLKCGGTIMTIEKIENGEYIFGNNMGHTTIESGNKWHLIEQKPAWSEEDEDILNTIINHFKVDIECTDEDDMVRWLKSLKERYTWKPSEEQMEAVKRASNGSRAIAGNDYLIMESLYQDLKKL